MFFGVLHRVQRRIHYLDLSALAASSGQAHFRSRDADQIPEGANGGTMIQCQHDCLIDKSHRSHTDRAARPGDQIDILRKQLADS